MYSLQDICRGLLNPRLIGDELRYWLENPHLLRSSTYSWYFRNLGHHDGENFFQKDWDNLIILDGCRFDLFNDVDTPEGDLSSIQSVASQTEEFLNKTIDGETFADTIYISANPQITKVNANFADVVSLWDDYWDDDLGTIHPKDVVEKTISTHEQHPNKRFIIHFVQPHMPFIGDRGRQIEHAAFQGGTLESNEENKQFVWSKLARGEVPHETVWEAYRENLELVLDELRPLLSALDGKTVLTSDHGNAVGERGVYGHPQYVHINALTQVPWISTSQSILS